MKCYSGDSGTGRISFEDLNLGVKVRIELATGITKLNAPITHNAPVNENINVFQFGLSVFTTGLIHHYDPSTQTFIQVLKV